MATTLSTDGPIGSASFAHWEEVATGATAPTHTLENTKGLMSAVQAFGTFGGATITLQGSCDGTNWVNLKDTSGTEISFTAAGGAEFSTAMPYIRPASSGGSSDDVDVIVVSR